MKNAGFFALLCRLMLGFIYLSAGLSKLGHHDFGNVIGPVQKEFFTELMNLPVWTAYAAAFIQSITGAFALTNSFAVWGILLMLPMNLGLLLFTINWPGTVFVNAFFLILSIFLVIFEWKKIKNLVLKRNLTERSVEGKSFAVYVILFSVLAFIFGIFLPDFRIPFMLAGFMILAYSAMDIISGKKLFTLDKIIVAIFFFCTFLFAFMPVIVTQLVDIDISPFFIIFGFVAVAIFLFFIRLIKYRKGNQSFK